MTAFKYVAVDPDGKKVRAKADAVNLDSLRNELLAQQLDVKKIRKKRKFTEIELTPRKVPRSDVMHFSRQVAAFVRAGIPLVEALETVRETASNARLREIITETEELIQVGVPFSDALDRHRDVFPPYYIGILRSAEITGRLDTVLEQLSSYIERDMEARQKIRSALTYPIVIMVMSVITVIVLVAYVLPKFTTFFKEFNAELPTVTKILLDIADFFENWWWALALGASGDRVAARPRQPLRERPALARPEPAAVAGDRLGRGVQRDRALLPHHRGDDARGRAASRTRCRPRSTGATTGCTPTPSGACATRCWRARAWPARSSPPACSRPPRRR